MFYRLTSAISGIGLLLVLGCSTTMVGPNDTPDAEWGYVLLRGQVDFGVRAKLKLFGQATVEIPLNANLKGPLQFIRLEPGLYRPQWVDVTKVDVLRGNASGLIVINDKKSFENGIEVRPGELVYIGEWNVTESDLFARLEVTNYASRDFQELEELFPRFSSLPRQVGFDSPERIDPSGLESGEIVFIQSAEYEPAVNVTPFHQAYGAMTFLASLELLNSLEPAEIDQFRSVLLSAFPESPPEKPTTIAEYALGGYTLEGDPLTVQLIITPLSSFTPEDEAEREGAMFGVVLLTNVLFDEESGQPTRKSRDPDLEVWGSILPSLYYEKNFVLFENGSLVSSSVYQETEGLDIASWIPIMLSDGLDAIAAADTLVRDGDPVNDALIPELLASDEIESLGEPARAAAALNMLLYTIAQGSFEEAEAELESIQREFAGITETTIRDAIDTQAPVVLELARNAAAEPAN